MMSLVIVSGGTILPSWADRNRAGADPSRLLLLI